MNLNQQSSGEQWIIHKNLMNSTIPIVDCGVHYVDIMCQMTKSKPVYVNAVGARLTEEIDKKMYNYGHLQVVFEDGSLGWYESGWGPMISETAFFIKDVIGPKGSVSIVEPKNDDDISSSNIDSHTKTNQLLIHYQDRSDDGKFKFCSALILTATEVVPTPVATKSGNCKASPPPGDSGVITAPVVSKEPPSTNLEPKTKGVFFNSSINSGIFFGS